MMVIIDDHNLRTLTETERSLESLVPPETFITQLEYDSIDRLIERMDLLGNIQSSRGFEWQNPCGEGS